MDSRTKPRIALVHDWMTNLAGGERVLLSLTKAFPGSPVYTSVYKPETMPTFKDVNVRTSFLQSWPLARSKHQLFPSLRTIAFESFDFSDYDIVISTNSAESKGIITGPRTKHINYIFTPTRYYWSGYHEYLQEPGFGMLNPFIRLIMPSMVKSMRGWDFAAAQRADKMVAISNYVAGRVEKYYRRQASVIYPPVDVDRLNPNSKRGNYYLIVSRLIPYKRVDLAVAACKELDLELIVIGDGSERNSLESIAGTKTKFLGRLSDREIAKYYSEAQMFIFTADEDFGITPLESMASGTPVIAYKKGGALETVDDGKTGVFFDAQTIESLKEAIGRSQCMTFDSHALRTHAEKFSEQRFIKEFQTLIDQEYENLLGQN